MAGDVLKTLAALTVPVPGPMSDRTAELPKESTTGTLAVRGILNNPDRLLLPGYFVRVRVPVDQTANALLVPDVALGSDQSGRYVLVVNAENVVEQRKVQIGQLDGDLRVVESGLKPDDKVVVAGLLRAIPGQKVDPQLKNIESGNAAAK